MPRRGAVLLVALATVAGAQGRAADPAGGLLLVANKGDHTLGIIDPAAGRQVATVKLSGTTGHEVVASPDGRTAYVPIYGDAGVGRPGSDGRTMDVIDIASRRRVATIDFGRPGAAARRGLRAGRPAVRDGGGHELDQGGRPAHEHRRGHPADRPEGVAHARPSGDGRTAYTSNVGPGTVSVVDVATKKVTAVVTVAARAQRIALSTDGRFVFTADQDSPRLAIIDTKTNKLAPGVALPGVAYGTAPTPDGRFLVMALPGLNQVGVLDLKSMEVVRTLDVPKAPQEVLVRPDGRVAYVSCDASGQVAEIDLVEWKVARLIAAGPMADGLAWAARP